MSFEKSNISEQDIAWLGQAIDLSRKCIPSERAFSVGCIIVQSQTQELIATGFSRETGEHVHAEEVALSKVAHSQVLSHCVLYSSLEPCSLRLSGRKSCVANIIEAGIPRVVFACSEPKIFVDCKGQEELMKRSIEVLTIEWMSDEVLKINQHLI